MTHTHPHAHDHDHGHDHGPERAFAVSVSSPSQTRRVLSIQVPSDEMDRERALVLSELKRDLRIPGFRKGKVPEGYIQKHYADAIQTDAVRNLLPTVYEQALHREHLIPIGDPRFENVEFEDGGLKFDALIEIRPEVVLKGYDRVSVRASRKAVGDEDVDKALSSFRERLAVFEPVKRPATPSDYLVIEYVALLPSGEPMEKARVKDYPVALSSESLLTEFRTGLVGSQAGDEKEIHVVYPADFGDAELAGKERTFRVGVKEVREKFLPEADDAFAKRIEPSLATVLELRLRIRQQLEAEEDARFRHEVDEKIIDAILTENPFEVPEAMVENYLTSLVEEDRRQHGNAGNEKDREREIREAFRGSAVRAIQKYFVVEAVKRQENIAVTPAEVDERVRAIAERLSRPEQEVRGMVEHPARRRGLENDILEDKAMAFLREKATVRPA